MSTGRILYFCPDFTQPSGGVRTIYRHVAVLTAAGLDAAVVHQRRGFRADWHTISAPVLWLEDRPQLMPDDTLIFPEVMADYVRQTADFAGRRLVFALSWSPAYSRLKVGERWADLGVDLVMAQSRAVQQALAWSMETSVAYVPPFVDPVLYDDSDTGERTRHVVYATRKDRAGEWLQGALTRRGLTGWSWQALRNLTETAYAAALRSALVYIPTTLQEGLHVSLLEAMACGALVVGFSGIGAGEYLIPRGEEQNCLLAENGNLLQLGEMLESTLAALAEDPDAYAVIRANGRSTARRYQDPQPQRDALLAIMGA